MTLKQILQLLKKEELISKDQQIVLKGGDDAKDKLKERLRESNSGCPPDFDD